MPTCLNPDLIFNRNRMMMIGLKRGQQKMIIGLKRRDAAFLRFLLSMFLKPLSAFAFSMITMPMIYLNQSRNLIQEQQLLLRRAPSHLNLGRGAPSHLNLGQEHTRTTPSALCNHILRSPGKRLNWVTFRRLNPGISRHSEFGQRRRNT